MAVAATVREISHEVRISLNGAPKLRSHCIGRSLRTPVGLRLEYGLGRDITRVDVTIVWEDAAELWPPSREMPGWLRKIIDEHRPADVDSPSLNRPTGMGGWPVYLTSTN